MKYLITGGGTGGHIYPALAIVEAIRRNDPDSVILYVGVRGKVDEEILKDKVEAKKFDIKFVRSSGFPRRIFSFKVFKFIFNLKIGISKSFFILLKFNPDIIIGTGGFGAFPIFFANLFFRKKTFIHEQNVHPGLANEIMGKISKRIGVSFRETLNFFPKGKTAFVGYPLRQIIKPLNKEASKIKLGFQPRKKIIFFFGGSQGARSINNVVVELLPVFLEKENIGIIHSAGRYVSSEYDAYSDTISKLNGKGIKGSITGKYLVERYFNNMGEVYSATDLVVSRSGAGTINELSAMGIPSILVPKSLVPGNHQFYNAKALADVGAAVIVKEKILSENGRKYEWINPKELMEIIMDVINNDSKLENMSNSVKSIYISDAPERICAEIFSLIK
jgi:UDP-N-acetylglucosamine--N-acetylmuramyl-(pentapeptide) pyrophosphoryl-undecaprenol N-acetylglucosamine transferase